MKIYSKHLRNVIRAAILCGSAWTCLAGATPTQAQTDASPSAWINGLASEDTQPADQAIQHGGQSFRIVKDANYRSAADSDSVPNGTIRPADFLQHESVACSSCGTSSCGGSCGTGSCGTGACRSGGLGGLSLKADPNRQSLLTCRGVLNARGPCEPCSPYRYASVEALYIQREDVGFSFPASGGTLALPGFDFEWAPRIVIGSVYDCVNGFEASLIGPFEWDASNQLDPEQTIALELFPNVPAVNSVIVGTTPSNVTSETTVSNQAQELTAEYFSVDASRTINGWEVAKLLFGARYVDYDENYFYSGTQTNVLTRDPIADDDGNGNALNTETTTTTTAQQVVSDIENQLIGVQIGLDLLYPIGRFAFSDTRLRAGGYANFAEASFSQTGTQSTLSNPTVFGDITTPLNQQNDTDDVEIAGLFEIGTGIRYQLGEWLSVRAGVELWYLAGIASATENVAGAGNSLDADDDILFTGFTFGSELRW